MDDIPIQVVAIPILAFVAVVATYVFRARATAGYDRQYANYRVDALAQRLGLNLVAGDPTFNLFIRHANAQMQRGPSDSRPVHIEVRLQGQPHGVPLELYYLHRVEQESGFTEVTRRTWTDCRMVAYTAAPFPPFEVLSRNAPLGPIVQIQPLPPVSTGNPMVDQTYQVATQEPAMAQLLGQALPAFAIFANSGVHLVGDGRSVAFVMKENTAPLLPNALYYAEQMSSLLSELARRVGG